MRDWECGKEENNPITSSVDRFMFARRESKRFWWRMTPQFCAHTDDGRTIPSAPYTTHSTQPHNFIHTCTWTNGHGVHARIWRVTIHAFQWIRMLCVSVCMCVCLCAWWRHEYFFLSDKTSWILCKFSKSFPEYLTELCKFRIMSLELTIFLLFIFCGAFDTKYSYIDTFHPKKRYVCSIYGTHAVHQKRPQTMTLTLYQ